jgi:Na+-driven multidrug efflux pump
MQQLRKKVRHMPDRPTPISESDAQHQRMTQTPIPKIVSSLAVPAMIGTLITVIYNTADTYFVSQINKSASAAVGAVYAIMSIIQAVGFGLGMGAGSLISRKLGAKENDAAHGYASSAFFAAVAFGALLTVSGLLVLKPLLRLLGCTDTMMPHAVPYAKYILLAAPVNCATFVLNNTLRSEGFGKLATIGIGAGIGCDGQVQVLHDILGMSCYMPKHAKCYANVGTMIRGAMKEYVTEVKEGNFPAQENSF